MRTIIRLLAAIAAFASVPLHAQQVVIVEEWIEVSDGGASRFLSPVREIEEHALAAYGPFRVVDGSHVALVGPTDGASPGHFAEMVRDWPALAVLDLVECPGTYDDSANLELGRMIRRAGLATRVPDGGSVRSGGVELFLAGAGREAADGAEFAVHSWMDEDGLQAEDYSATAPENRKYLAYYREMGMTAEQAQAFYAMTNSVPHEQALWLTGSDMRRWIGEESGAKAAAPRLAYLDLGASLN